MWICVLDAFYVRRVWGIPSATNIWKIIFWTYFTLYYLFCLFVWFVCLCKTRQALGVQAPSSQERWGVVRLYSLPPRADTEDGQGSFMPLFVRLLLYYDYLYYLHFSFHWGNGSLQDVVLCGIPGTVSTMSIKTRGIQNTWFIFAIPDSTRFAFILDFLVLNKILLLLSNSASAMVWLRVYEIALVTSRVIFLTRLS